KQTRLPPAYQAFCRALPTTTTPDRPTTTIHKVSTSDAYHPNTALTFPYTPALTITIQNLTPNNPYIIALLPVDLTGQPLSPIGRPTKPVVSCFPLPVVHCWAVLADVAGELACTVVEDIAGNMVWKYFVES